MARKQNRILPMEESWPAGRKSGRSSGRLVFWLVASLACLMVVAYIDGGEEPLRPISERVTVPEAEE